MLNWCFVITLSDKLFLHISLIINTNIEFPFLFFRQAIIINDSVKIDFSLNSSEFLIKFYAQRDRQKRFFNSSSVAKKKSIKIDWELI